MIFLLSANIFQNILPGITSECQTAWIQIRPNILSDLIWVQTVCKEYQQMTKVAASKDRVNSAYWVTLLCILGTFVVCRYFSKYSFGSRAGSKLFAKIISRLQDPRLAVRVNCQNQITQTGKACANKIVPDQPAPREAF